MKILTLSNCPLNESQGSGYVTVNYARGLAARGHEVTLLGPESLELWRGWRGARRHRLALGMLASVLTRMPRRHYDIVEFYGADSCLAVAALRRWPARRSLLVNHSNGLEPHCEERMKRWLGHATLDGAPPRWHQTVLRLPLASAFRGSDALVTVSENDAAYACARRFPPSGRLLAIENPLPDSFLAQDVSFARTPHIGYCGSWLPLKGCRLIADALPRVLAEFAAARLTLVGVGEGFRAEDHFPQALLDRISVLPFIADKEELRRTFKSLSIAIVPSIYESFCLAAAEAMACGCALVATQTGFAASLRHREEAITFAEPTAEALADGLRTLLHDDPLREHVARGGYVRVQQLRWDAAISRLEEAYTRWFAEVRAS